MNATALGVRKEESIPPVVSSTQSRHRPAHVYSSSSQCKCIRLLPVVRSRSFDNSFERGERARQRGLGILVYSIFQNKRNLCPRLRYVPSSCRLGHFALEFHDHLLPFAFSLSVDEARGHCERDVYSGSVVISPCRLTQHVHVIFSQPQRELKLRSREFAGIRIRIQGSQRCRLSGEGSIIYNLTQAPVASASVCFPECLSPPLLLNVRARASSVH